MLWTLRFDPVPAALADAPAEGRFVLQRHHDSAGPHYDLRLEQPGGFLLGWRIDASTLDGDLPASEKAPHPLTWLDQDGDAIREDAGAYRWITRDEHGGTILLDSPQGRRVLNVSRGETFSAAALRAIQDTATRLNVHLEDAARLLADGLTARARAIERFCGLGRELDGPTFDENLWRKTLHGLPLTELQSHLRGYEIRFDAKYPPQPVSRPAALETASHAASERVLALLRN